MKAILDTHVFFWWMKQDPRLAAHHRALIEHDQNEIFISAVTGWEIATKVRLGKWPEAAVLLPDLAPKILAAGFDIIPLTFPQAERAGSLDHAHRDPFDRMLAAQALELDVILASVDPAFSAFGCKVS